MSLLVYEAGNACAAPALWTDRTWNAAAGAVTTQQPGTVSHDSDDDGHLVALCGRQYASKLEGLPLGSDRATAVRSQYRLCVRTVDNHNPLAWSVRLDGISCITSVKHMKLLFQHLPECGMSFRAPKEQVSRRTGAKLHRWVGLP